MKATTWHRVHKTPKWFDKSCDDLPVPGDGSAQDMEPDASSSHRLWWPRYCRTRCHAAPNSRSRAPRQPSAPFAALIMLVMLAGCSAVPLLDSAEPAVPPSYGTLVSDVLKKFKGYASYTNFEISAARWVHAPTGWNWLVCVRYNDGQQQRYYSFFIDNNRIVTQRYDIVTDQCTLQQYVPFDATTGTVGSPTPVRQQPIY